ncbi:hypothetical protein J2W49_002737 [Hydrogenophaga palleronii]|uniref:DUF6933 domain-containing protein n=1 Tax=Hydrogenophaga palleronii TaxID=65655 RepID=A0ABU1WNZ3_9BURK|nr:hypothetical protein [Hydrogenophaga palleronii]MDR7150774.1 hypothetical protein [Hydrogenophaga palleronii]
MLYLKCTGEAQKAIGLRKTDLVEAQAVTAPLGNWYVHRFPIGRTKFFLFMSESNLLSFVLYQGKKPVTVQTLPNMLMAGLTQLLAMKGFEPARIDRALQAYQTGLFAKTDSRKLLGCMNDLVWCYTAAVEFEGGLDSCNLTDIIMKMNDMPQRTLDGRASWDLVEVVLRHERDSVL